MTVQTIPQQNAFACDGCLNTANVRGKGLPTHWIKISVQGSRYNGYTYDFCDECSNNTMESIRENLRLNRD